MSKKTIYIFENSNAPHETSIVSSIKLFRRQGFNIILCLNQKAIERIVKIDELKNIKIINIGQINGLIQFVRNYQKGDYILFNTILMRSLFIVTIVSAITTNKIYYLRNINSWFIKPTVSTSLKNKILGNILFFTKKILIKNAKYIAVGSYNMKEYLSTKTSKPSFVIPFNIFDKRNIYLKHKDIFTIVIPGNIDLKRKNLEIIKEATLMFDNEYLSKFKLILLGRPVSENDKIFVEQWKKKLGECLVYYDKFIPDDEFENTLKKSDIISGILNVNYIDKYGNREMYGKTKDTGIEAHAIAYAKPLLVNTEYSVDKCLETTTLKFKDSRDYYKKLKDLINENITFNTAILQKNSEKYSLEKLRIDI